MFSLQSSLAWEVFDWIVAIILIIWTIFLMIGYYDYLIEEHKYSQYKAKKKVIIDSSIVGLFILGAYAQLVGF